MSGTDFLIGYGSLLSAYSRQTYSNLHMPVIPVMVSGWQRGWTTRYGDEAATYLGVRPAAGASLSAALVPTHITDELRHRERGYDFTPVGGDAVRLLHADAATSELETARFWIVVNREQLRADQDHPIAQSYIDTCLIGCLETGGAPMARHFIKSTELWDGHRVDDRDWPTPLYPRGTPANAAQRSEIDTLLRAAGV
ncbi:gamma-glutamylcyclotransferase [Maricaulis salignorans]|uniref:gamma-glutamylcyclotransferase n=1 Tax=Maricaulis salignorans TaxID=144026 RepID=UPI003A940494